MYRNLKNQNMSELEQEFELEMDDDLELEMDDEYEFESFESDEDSESDEYEYESDYEDDPQAEFEWLETNNSDYGERFFELSQREFESESEIDEAVDEILDDMENEFFLGSVFKKATNAVKGLAKKGVALAKKAGIKLPSIDALKSMLGPVAGLLKGNLGALIKPAIKAALSAHPAGMAALPALKALGFESSEDMSENREAWDNYAAAAREAFEHLAANINVNADNPVEASRLAANAFQKGLKVIEGSRQNGSRRRNPPPQRSSGRKKVRRLYLAPGETLVIRRKN